MGFKIFIYPPILPFSPLFYLSYMCLGEHFLQMSDIVAGQRPKHTENLDLGFKIQ